MSPGLHVLHLTTASQPIAGAERLLVDIARHGRQHGWTNTFVTLAPRGELHDLVEAEGCANHALGLTSPRQVGHALRTLRRILRQCQPDVLHTHLHHASILGAATAGAIPVVHSRHYSDYMERFRGPVARALDGWAARRAAQVIAVSDAAGDHLLGEGVPKARLHIVPNGVDLDRIDALDLDQGRRVLAGLGWGPGPFIGCAASFHPRKGHDVLVAAFAVVAAQVPTARLALLGQGPGQDAVRSQLQALGLADRVALLGHHPLGHEVMAVLDAYVQPSIEEGFGLAVVEAMAMSRPVVVSDVGGMRQTVEDGVSGLRVPPGDATALAQAILSVLSDARRAAALGAAARQRVAQRYSVHRMLAQYDHAYRNASGKNQGE